ncbi:PREDICTED: uncharacterized protein LOC105457284 [Wasmannia auropunctata]|uniref:uncharacterized protein LOC105457284 n=1 Tax=Wasmannia auropunctata TaxID=64793 RepID=UPI0005EFC625|nr:PREDICTED: uncharacterized protein LOC105457284 [Wasmannia auropunctata]
MSKGNGKEQTPKEQPPKELIPREAEALIRSQIDLYGKIARAYDNLKKQGVANITIGLAEACLQALESNWAKFEAQHDRLAANFWEALAGHEYLKKDISSLAEETFITQKGVFLETLRCMKAKAKEEPPAAPVTAPHRPRTTLPRIQLPQFSSRYEDWPSFRDLFHSIIGKDAATTQVEKLHYLQSCLKGKADLLIRSLTTTNENFERAWKALTDYYENKQLLVRSYIAQSTALQKLKSESAPELRKLFHCVLNTVGSLEGIGRPITRGEGLFVYLIVELLDSKSRREWENAISETTEPPSYSDLRQFLERLLHILESLQPIKPETGKADASPAKTSETSTRQAARCTRAKRKISMAAALFADEIITSCDAYQAKTAEERKKHVEKHHLCINYLGKHKLSECASQRTCTSCNARHHSTLHDACRADKGAKSTEVARVAHLAQRPPEIPVAVLLATARVRVKDRTGADHFARALTDQGSDSSLISESLAQRLRLILKPTSVAVFGVEGKRTGFARGLVDLLVSPRGSGPPTPVSAIILPRLTLQDGGIKVERRTWAHINGLEFTDPKFLAADSIDILLGADVYASILQAGLRKGGPYEPVAQKTKLGWILSGVVGRTADVRRAQTLQCRAEENLPALVQKFWLQEEAPAAAPPPLTPAEQNCEDFFRRTHARTAEGRYVVRLPVVEPLSYLASTRQVAQRVPSSMEKRFEQDVRLRQLYLEFLLQYEELGHMEIVDRTD